MEQQAVTEKKVQITVPEDLWARVKASAALERREISELAVDALQNYLSAGTRQ